MRLLFVIATVCSNVPASATEPEQAVTTPAATAATAPAATPGTPSSPVAASAQSSQPAAATVTKADAGQETAVARVPSGYKAKEIGGETVYCRKSTPLGSRFPTEVCMTVAQYEESVRQRDGLRQELTGRQKSYSITQ
jgi:uncharacterized protein YkwD